MTALAERVLYIRWTRTAGSLLRQVLAVDLFHALAADSGDDIAEALTEVRRRRTQHGKVALVVETGTERDLASGRRGNDHDLLGEINFGDLVADLPGLPHVLECLGVRNNLRRLLGELFILHTSGPLLDELHLFLLRTNGGREEGDQHERHKCEQRALSTDHDELLFKAGRCTLGPRRVSVGPLAAAPPRKRPARDGEPRRRPCPFPPPVRTSGPADSCRSRARRRCRHARPTCRLRNWRRSRLVKSAGCWPVP